jgi:hypothetical protein
MDRAEHYYRESNVCAEVGKDQELRGMTGQNRGVLANVRGGSLHPGRTLATLAGADRAADRAG